MINPEPSGPIVFVYCIYPLSMVLHYPDRRHQLKGFTVKHFDGKAFSFLFPVNKIQGHCIRMVIGKINVYRKSLVAGLIVPRLVSARALAPVLSRLEYMLLASEDTAVKVLSSPFAKRILLT